MFTGRSRRPVNLGSRKQATTHDALRNAEKQRSKREAQRRELRATLTIQTLFKSRLMLKEARINLARTLQHKDVADLQPEAIAYVLPVIFELKQDERDSLIQRFMSSGNDHVYFELLVSRLHFIWDHRPINASLCETGFGILRHQNPPHIGASVYRSLLGLSTHIPVHAVLEWAAVKDPSQLLAVLLMSPKNDIDALPLEVLRPLFHISSLPTQPRQDSLRSLISKTATSSEAWPLVSALVGAADPHSDSLGDLESALCSRKFIQTVVVHNPPLDAAKYISTLLTFFPKARPDILLHLLLAKTPSPLHSFWDAYKNNHENSLLYVVVELFSYWLLVATDAELISNTSMGLAYGDLVDLATVVRDQSFNILWNTEPHQRFVLSDYETAILKLLRQLYTRDSRRQLFTPGFWLMEDRIPRQGQFFMDSVDEGLFESTVEDEDDDLLDDVDDEVANLKLVLKPSPSLRILEFAPFFVSFEMRVALFYRCIDKERDNRRYGFEMPMHFAVNRETLTQDAQALFRDLGPRIKKDLRVQFISNGIPERGIDGGGLMKEFLMAVSSEIFKKEPQNSERPLFVETANHTLSPNPIYGENPQSFTPEVSSRYFFLGQVIGKCLYENLLVDVEFASFFLAKWNLASAAHSVRSTFDDLYLLDAELYNNMAKLHNIHGNELADLGLDFTIVGSQGQEVELRPNGSKIAVTDANKLEYMRELANYKLNFSLRPQTVRFLQGLGQIIRLEWLNMFNPKEINKLISGETQDIDIDDLRRHTEVSGFDGHDTALANFWQVLEELTPEQRGKFLKFVTSAPKGPLLGFDKLDPHFGIRCAGSDDNRLPTSSTCVNLLKLPAYSSIETLRKKLIYSIESGAGFDLS